MRTLVLERSGVMAWHDAREPTCQPHEALVRIRQCGVCGTDRHAYNGRQPFLTYPIRLGHELSAEVVAAPEGSAVKPGDRCAINPYVFCGACIACRMGKENCCESMRVLGVHMDGGHAPRLAVPVANLLVSNGLSLESLALVEPLVIGYHAVMRAGLVPGDSAVVVGQGPIGIAVAFFARATGAELVIVEKRPDCLERSEQILGVRGLAPGSDLPHRLRLCLGGELPRVVFDATGNPEAMHSSFDLPGHGGSLVFVGHFPGDVTFNDPDFHRRELTLLASRNGTTEDFRAVLRYLEDGTVDAACMITHRFAFDEMHRRFADLDTMPGLVKAMITIS